MMEETLILFIPATTLLTVIIISGAPFSTELTTLYRQSTESTAVFARLVNSERTSSSSPFISTTNGAPSLPINDPNEFSSWKNDNSRPSTPRVCSESSEISSSGESFDLSDNTTFIVAVLSPSKTIFCDEVPEPTWL